MNKKYPLKIGSLLIADLMHPQPEELDMEAINRRLMNMPRFSGAAGTLDVHQHRHLVTRLVREDRDNGFDGDSYDLYRRVLEWAYHHDDHEGVIGDIVSPVKRIISDRTNILEIVETRLDIAICYRLGIEVPNSIVRKIVHKYDKAAETIEWVYALGNELQEFNHPCPAHLFDRGAELIEWARQHT